MRVPSPENGSASSPGLRGITTQSRFVLVCLFCLLQNIAVIQKIGDSIRRLNGIVYQRTDYFSRLNDIESMNLAICLALNRSSGLVVIALRLLNHQTGDGSNEIGLLDKKITTSGVPYAVDRGVKDAPPKGPRQISGQVKAARNKVSIEKETVNHTMKHERLSIVYRMAI